MIAAIGGILGLIFGSFATVAAHRIPRRESIVTGRSKCPSCGHVITAAENIPVVSYVVQRGRCRHCGAPIAARYPMIELATGALFAATGARFGLSLEAVVYASFFWVLVVLTVIDLEHRLLPDRIVGPAFLFGWLGLAAAALAGDESSRLIGAGMGALIFGGFFVVVALIVPAGMGGGDVKLAFVLGSFLGYIGAPGVVLVGMFLSFLAGAVIGVGVMVATGGNRKMAVPFGPFLAAGTAVAIFTGPQLLDAYLSRL